MLKRFSTNYAIFSMVLDGTLVMGALKLAHEIRPELSSLSDLIKDFPNPPEIKLHFYLIFAFLWVLTLFALAIYDPEKKLRLVDELTSLFWGCLIALTINAGLLYLTNRELSRVLFLSFGFLATLALLAHHLLYRAVFQRGFLRSANRNKILIVGAGVVGRQIAAEIKGFRTLGFEVVGFVDDDPGLRESSPEVLGSLDDTVSILKSKAVDSLVIALPRRAYDRIDYLVGEVHNLPVRVWVIPDYFALALNQAAMVDFAGFPLIDLRAPALNTFQRIGKRIFDLVIAVPLVVLLLPMFGLIGLVIKLDSPGPVFFRSKRLKENGEVFEMLKFRTMTRSAHQHLEEVMQVDAEGHLIHKRPDDPRVTRVGRFLRKTSLDELPNLVNVILGDMSLVGPRPELPEMVERYEPWQRRRFAIPQGITGYWQVNGRSDKPMHLHTDEDIYYIQHYSIWFDIQILLKTIWVVIRGKGAY